MSTYTKKTVVIWGKTDYESAMFSTEGSAPSSQAFAEFSEKTEQMVADGVMEPNYTVDINESTICSIRYFTNEESAQEWLEFNDELASTHNLTKVSSYVRDVLSIERV